MKIDKALVLAQAELDKMIVQLGLEKKLKGWKVVVKNVARGHCRVGTRYISIPLWAFEGKSHRVYGRLKQFRKVRSCRRDGYAKYYLCHEAAHAISGRHSHDQQFMRTLIKICPPKFIHYECNYMPTAALAAGIKPKKKRRNKT